jgi:hypothetical protein
LTAADGGACPGPDVVRGAGKADAAVEKVRTEATSETPRDKGRTADADDGHGHGHGAAEQRDVGEIKIDPELANLLPRHTAEERAQLEKNLQKAGVCRDPILRWKERNVFLDGHTRREICEALKIPYTVMDVELPDQEAARDWIIANQLGRRNLTDERRTYFRGALYNLRKQRHGGARRDEGSSAQNAHSKTADVLAGQCGVSAATIRRDGEFARDLDKIVKNCGEEVGQAILSGESGATRKDVAQLAKKAPEEQAEAARQLLGEAKAGGAGRAGRPSRLSRAAARPRGGRASLLCPGRIAPSRRPAQAGEGATRAAGRRPSGIEESSEFVAPLRPAGRGDQGRPGSCGG